MPKDEPIPSEMQPDPAHYAFDLDAAFASVVGLRAKVPADAFTAASLGTEREGSGVVIGADGLILTIGYLITESDEIWITTGDGQILPGHALAYDQASGFGLVAPLGRLRAPPIELGVSAAAELGETAIFVSAGGRRMAVETRIVGRQEFAGYWEYLIEDALFIAPAHPFWGGGALISRAAKLLGIGSLSLQQDSQHGQRLDMNMVVPVDLLRPILDDLMRQGAVSGPPRPWLGLYALEDEQRVVVGGVAEGGPADIAGLRQGDEILSVAGEAVESLAGLWRSVLAQGPARTRVALLVQRDEQQIPFLVASVDHRQLLKKPSLH